MAEEIPTVRRHLLIAGTGRAGTSFLVRYLAELGLDTHLGRAGDNPTWDEDANAGLENLPLLDPNADLPYVVKSPWLYQLIDEVLTTDMIAIDAVVIPVRDLAEAAASRSILEQRSILQGAPWMVRLERSWEEWGHVPGGAVYSLNPIDQGRLLAVGFHHLVQRLVAASVPVVFLAFPKFVEDPSYLFSKLGPLLPPSVDHGAACAAHRRVVDPAKVRVGSEVESLASEYRSNPTKVMDYESHSGIDVIALRRELTRVSAELMRVSAELVEVSAEHVRVSSELVEVSSERVRVSLELIRVSGEIEAAIRLNEKNILLEAELNEAHRVHLEKVGHFDLEVERVTQEVPTLQGKITSLSQEIYSLSYQNEHLKAQLAGVYNSRSWRLTTPLRWVGEWVRGRR
jgi:hypothetical protein